MPNTVIALKKSATPSASPADLANGELAINYADGKLFYKNTAGYIAEISGGGGGGGNSFGTVNANSTLIVADTSGDVLTLIAGSNIQIVGDAINDTITISASLSGGGDPGPAFDQANAAYDRANSAQTIAIAAFDKANTGGGGGGGAPTTNVVTANAVVTVKDNRYFLTNTSFTTVTLPATPSVGDTVYIVVTNGLSNNVVARNGSRIMSLDEDLTLDITYYSLGLTYVTANLGWVII